MRIFIMIAFALPVVLSSCEKWYCCGYPGYTYQCIKGADTNYVTVTGTVFTIQRDTTDSLNFYNNQGYACTQDGAYGLANGLSNYGFAGYGTRCVGGKAACRKALLAGEMCSGDNITECQAGDYCYDQ